MIRAALLACVFLAGCSSLSQRTDYYETRYRGMEALTGDAQAFDRLGELQAQWQARAAKGSENCPAPCGASAVKADAIGDATRRIVRGRDAVLAQRELADVTINALADLESEHDALMALLLDNDAPAALLSDVAEQKYLARRMANSLVLMSQMDMTRAVEAADLFGRDAARFQKLLDAAINGDEEMGIDPPDNPEVEDSLSQIEEIFTGYVADATTDLLDNVAYRYDAWLALADLAAFDDRPGKAARPAGPAAGNNEDQAASTEESESSDAAMDEDAAPAVDEEASASDDMSGEGAADDAGDVPAGDDTDSGEASPDAGDEDMGDMGSDEGAAEDEAYGEEGEDGA